MRSTHLASITCLDIIMSFQTPGRACADATHAAHGFASAPSGNNGRSCCASCLAPAADVESNCGHVVKEVLAKTFCIELIGPATTTTIGCDDARVPTCRIEFLRNLSWSSSCTPDVKSFSCTRAPSDVHSAVRIMLNVGRVGARGLSDDNTRPSCANCIPPAFNVSRNCKDVAEDVLTNSSCIKLTAPAATPAVGRDGARAPMGHADGLSRLSCNSCCTPDVKSAG